MSTSSRVSEPDEPGAPKAATDPPGMERRSVDEETDAAKQVEGGGTFEPEEDPEVES